ncbi:hypothetical protein XENOCAPTIV_019863 [Xenoophorus captivus]|uniref:Uncharacterized protein n=1 Tax=Xenoophorus captivus TaxID=1517983 RepID=A0ABV0RJH3_9TELE
MERLWVGADRGGGQVGSQAQEVALEAEADAVVVQGPRSVLLPSVLCLWSVPWVVKLKSEGFSLPLGSLMLGSRSSSKKECAQASRGVRRAVGVYSSKREQRAMASGGVRGRKTWTAVRDSTNVLRFFIPFMPLTHIWKHTDG